MHLPEPIEADANRIEVFESLCVVHVKLEVIEMEVHEALRRASGYDDEPVRRDLAHAAKLLADLRATIDGAQYRSAHS